MEQNGVETPVINNAVESNISTTSEKMIPQSKVNEIVQARVNETATRVRSEYEQKSQTQPAYQSTQPANVHNQEYQSATSSNQINEEKVRELIKNEYEQTRDLQMREYAQREGARIETEIMSRLDSVKSKYADYDTTVTGFPFAAFPNSVLASVGFENTGDILVDLAKNPTKLEQLESLAQRDPSLNLVKREMQRLSESIKLNEKAASAKTSNPPLSQILPSSLGADDGSLSLKDLKRIYRG